MELISMTNVTAPPILVAVSSLPETPRNGQIPRKYASTKLLIKLALMKIIGVLGKPIERYAAATFQLFHANSQRRSL